MIYFNNYANSFLRTFLISGIISYFKIDLFNGLKTVWQLKVSNLISESSAGEISKTNL